MDQPTPRRILAIDTTSALGSVALVADGGVLAELSATVRARHGETLLPHVDRVLSAAGVPVGDVDLFAVALGPGSFTGLRVGVAAAKGLALSTGRPLSGVGTPRAIARGLGVTGVAVVLLGAYRGEVYGAAYRLGAELDELVAPFHAAPADAARALRAAVGSEPVVACGDGLRRHHASVLPALGPCQVAPPVFDAPRAALVAVEAAARFARLGPDDVETIEPLYVRASDVATPPTP